MLSKNFASYMKKREGRLKNGRRSDLGRSSSIVQCFECNGCGHVQKECANLLKQNKRDDKNDSDTDSYDGEKLKNFVAFTTFVSGGRKNLRRDMLLRLGQDLPVEVMVMLDDGGSFDLAGNY